MLFVIEMRIYDLLYYLYFPLYVSYNKDGQFMVHTEFTKTCTNKKVILMKLSFVDFYEKKLQIYILFVIN